MLATPVGRLLLLGGAGPLVLDSFTRPNSALSLGNAETGQVWVPVNLTWGINTNRAYNTNTGGTNSHAVVESGIADCVLEVDYTGVSASGYGGISFRSDGTTQNWWRAFHIGSAVFLDKVIAGVASTVANPANATTTGTMRVVLLGSSIQVFIGSTRVINVVDAALVTNTKHGLYLANDGNVFLDNFRCLKRN